MFYIIKHYPQLQGTTLVISELSDVVVGGNFVVDGHDVIDGQVVVGDRCESEFGGVSV